MKRNIRKYGYIAAAVLAMSVLFVGCGQEKEPDTQLWETISKEENAQNGGTGDNDAAGAGTADATRAAEGTGTAGNNDSGGAAEGAGTAGNTEDEVAGIYGDIIAEYRDMVQNNFYQDLLEKRTCLPMKTALGKTSAQKSATHRKFIMHFMTLTETAHRSLL